jgi:hypothetical protein
MDKNADFNPQLPLPLTLTPQPTPLNTPPDRPPDPGISILFPEITPYRAPDNPFRHSLTETLKKAHRTVLKEAMNKVRKPFQYFTDTILDFDGSVVGAKTTSEDFNAAVLVVTAALERGYYPHCDFTLLGPSDWAKLSCTMLAAVGCGYYRQEAHNSKSTLEKVRDSSYDPEPLDPKFPMLFHCLAATADHLEMHIGIDQSNYQDWYLTIKETFLEKATKAATAEVEEKWLHWKAKQIDRRAATQEVEITNAVRSRNASYFTEMATQFGLQFTQGTLVSTASIPTTGKKRLASGTIPKSTPSAPSATRIQPAHATKRMPSPATP